MKQRPFVRRYARQLTRNADMAADLEQDVMLRALSKWHLFERGTRMDWWIGQMTHNTYVNRIRAIKRAPEYIDFDHAYGVTAPANQESDAEVADLFSLLAMLDPLQRYVLGAIRWGERYKEVADISKLPVGTVRSRLSRGRAAMRELAVENGFAQAARFTAEP